MISIIIPFYKNVNEIERSLKSVFNQTFQDFEVILINDASPDWQEALPIINSIKDHRLRLISHKTNKYGAEARNTGIKAAKGEYIAFLDADDEWYSNHLKDSLEYLTKNNYDLISSKVKLINKKGTFISPRKQKRKTEPVATYLFVKGMAMYTPSIFCKCTLAESIGFDESIRRHQDFDFLLRAESDGYLLGTSPHLGAIVHWENNDTIKKGETWQFSNEWLMNRKELLNKKEIDNFWLQFVGFKILRESKKLFLLEFLKNKINPFYLNRSRIWILIRKLFK